MRRWLGNKATSFEGYNKGKKMHAEFIALLIQTRDQLDSIYSGELKNDVKLYQKELIFAELRKRYEVLKARWGDNRYDAWFGHNLNNARLATVGTYYDLVPAFQSILAEVEGDLGRFYSRVEQLSQLNKRERNKLLLAYSNQ